MGWSTGQDGRGQLDAIQAGAFTCQAEPVGTTRYTTVELFGIANSIQDYTAGSPCKFDRW